jgi:hypothetical protein
MAKSAGFHALIVLWFVSPLLIVAQVANQTPVRPDYSKEAFVLEQSSDKFKFQNDGTHPRDKHAGPDPVGCWRATVWGTQICLPELLRVIHYRLRSSA